MSEQAGQTQESSEAPERGRRQGNDIALGKYIRIDLSQRLPDLDRPTAQAYAASDSRVPGQPMYVLICGEDVPPRLNALALLSRLDGLPAIMPMDWGPIPWNGPDDRRFAIAYQRPAGNLVASDPDARIDPMREDLVIEGVIQPVYRVLNELYARAMTHRAIAINNVFTSGAASRELVLGECVSGPPAMFQPTIFETISGAQTDPIGRGAGGIEDDLYALGVLVTLLIRGGNPMAGWSDYDIVAQKIERGSYAALLGRTRVSLKLMEPLRGLLCDEPTERWRLHDLEMWLNGRQLSPKQASLPEKSRRAFQFNGKEYWNCKSLAHALANDWQSALQVAATGEVERWAQRSLPNERHAQAIVSTVASSQAAQGGSGGDRALARLLIALDPAAPIRLRSMSFKIEALPQALALAYDDEAKRAVLVEAVLGKLPQRWLELQPENAPEPPQLLPPFDRISFYLERRQLGNGIERCVYEFNPDWPCLSPLVRGAYVVGMEELLPALERRAEKGPPDQEPVDRHIVAFCAARMQNAPDKVLQGLARARDDLTRHRAILHLLARVQKRYGPKKVPALTKWMAGYARDIVDALHNVKTRERMHKQLERAVEAGTLVDLLANVDDPAVRKEDASGFHAAQEEYARNLREISWLENGGLTSRENIARATRTWATAVSGLLSGIILMLVTVFYVS